jgi:diacylglycerol O-acyltransferase
MTDMPALNHRMTSLDASFLYLEQPNSLLHVGGIYTFAHPLDYQELVADVHSRLPLVPRYTQRAVPVPLNLSHPTWEPDPEFDIERHIIAHSLPRPGGDAELSALCAGLFAEPLDRGRPLWDMHLIQEYGTGCALLARVHHCMIDGASGVQLLNLLMDPTPRRGARDQEVTAPRRQRRESLPNPVTQAVTGVVDLLRMQVGIGRVVAGHLLEPSKAIAEARYTLDAISTLVRTLLSGVPPTPFNGTLSTRRALAWSRLSLNEVKAVKNRLGGTVNDVVLAVIAGALRHYLRDRGLNVDRTELRTLVPVNVRTEHEQLKLGNRVSMMVAPLPIGITDPLERLRQVSAAMDLLKSGGQSAQMERVVALTDLMPPFLQAPLARLQASVSPVNTVCTNVPGPRETRYLLGQPVQLMVPLVPLAAGIGLGFAIMSYSNQLTIGVNADAERVPDAWKISDALHKSFDELWAVTGLERVTAPAIAHPAGERHQPVRAKRKSRSTHAARTAARASSAAPAS